MTTTVKKALAILAVLWIPLSTIRANTAQAADPTAMSVDDIRDCVEKAGPQRSSVQTGVLRTVEGDTVNESEAKFYWKKFDDGLSRALIRFSSPPDLRGSAVLVIEMADDADSDIFMYLPEFRSVRRITAGMMSGSMFGTDFTFEEFERLYGLTQEMESKRIADTDVEGRATFAIETTPKEGEESAYTRVVQHIEQERCVPLKTEFFGTTPEPVKVMSTDPAKLSKVGGAWFPDQIVMRDIETGTHTTVSMKKTEVDIDVPDRTFSQRSMSRGR
jgi:hypothetical protein